MAEFINTADVIGDEEMCDQIITRTVTEYKENRIVQVGQYAFYGCTALTEVDVPNVTTIGNSAFQNCSSLMEANLPLVTSIPNSCFNGCTVFNGTGLDFSKITNLGMNSFRDCKGLSELKLPLVTDITSNAFYSCSGMEKADLPKATVLGADAFYNCVILSTLILRSETMCSCVIYGGAAPFSNTAIANGNGYIYVPRALVDTYKAATNWSTYAAQFRALEDYTVDGTTTGELDETKI